MSLMRFHERYNSKTSESYTRCISFSDLIALMHHVDLMSYSWEMSMRDTSRSFIIWHHMRDFLSEWISPKKVSRKEIRFLKPLKNAWFVHKIINWVETGGGSKIRKLHDGPACDWDSMAFTMHEREKSPNGDWWKNQPKFLKNILGYNMQKNFIYTLNVFLKWPKNW